MYTYIQALFDSGELVSGLFTATDGNNQDNFSKTLILSYAKVKLGFPVNIKWSYQTRPLFVRMLPSGGFEPMNTKVRVSRSIAQTVYHLITDTVVSYTQPT